MISKNDVIALAKELDYEFESSSKRSVLWHKEKFNFVLEELNQLKDSLKSNVMYLNNNLNVEINSDNISTIEFKTEFNIIPRSEKIKEVFSITFRQIPNSKISCYWSVYNDNNQVSTGEICIIDDLYVLNSAKVNEIVFVGIQMIMPHLYLFKES